MLQKDQFLGLVQQEFKILRHLGTKVTTESVEYKPTEKQRTTRELMAFLTFGPHRAAQAIVTGDMSLWSDFEAKEKEAEASMRVEDFASKLDMAEKDILEWVGGMTDEQFQELYEVPFMPGMKMPKVLFLMTLLLEQLVAYRMQFFLYLKASGRTELNTNNLWQGEDGSM